MAIAITSTGASVILDETDGLQNATATPATVGDSDDNDILGTSIPSEFLTRLSSYNLVIDESALSGYTGAAGNVGLNVVNISGATSSTNFALTGVNGAVFPTYDGLSTTTSGFDSGLSVVDDNGVITEVFLFNDPTNNNIVYGVAGAQADDPIAFAVYLQEQQTSGITTGAKLWTTLVGGYTLSHLTDGDTPAAYDDSLDLSGKLYIAGVAQADFPFAGAPSGQNLFMMFGTTSLAILVTGEDPANESAGESVVNGGDTVNTGQGGGATTLGTNSQQIGAQDALVVTFVTGANSNYLVPNLSPGEATDESDIQFSGYATGIKGADITISQMTPGSTSTKATVELDAYRTTDGTGDNYIDGAALVSGDTPINILSVQVLRGGTDVVGTAGVNVTLAGNTATITGVQDDDVLRYTTDSDHNRVLVRNDQPTKGAGSNIAFDLGGVNVIQVTSDVTEIGSKVHFEDDGPTILVDNASGTYTSGAQDDWTHNPGTDGFHSLSLTLNDYKIGANSLVTVNTSLGTKTTTDTNGDYVFTGSIGADFNGDGKVDTVGFSLTFDPVSNKYDVAVTTPPETIQTFDTSQGALKAGGPDAVQTLLIPNHGDVVFFGAVATAPASGGTGPEPNDILDLVSPITDLTEQQLEALNATNLINTSTKMNVSTSGIGINNNNLDGVGATISAGDESFVVNPVDNIDKVRVYIDNSVGGYTPSTEKLYYTVYYTDQTTSGPTLVDATTPALRSDPSVPQVARGGTYFEIDGGAKQIDAIQLTMAQGTIKIPVIQFSIEQDFTPQPLQMDLTANLVDGDGDNHTSAFHVDLLV